MALCSDLLVVAEDAKIGYPPARVWGVPDDRPVGLQARARRGRSACCSPATRSPAARRSTGGWRPTGRPPPELDDAFEALLERVARIPVNQLVMHKLLVNQGLYAQGLAATQALGTFFDGIARHTPEGFDFVRRAAEAGFKEAVRDRDEPFGDFGLARGSEPGP